MVMSFNRGYSNFWTNFLLLKKFDRIVTSGAWSTLRGCEENKFYQKMLSNYIQKMRNIDLFLMIVLKKLLLKNMLKI